MVTRTRLVYTETVNSTCVCAIVKTILLPNLLSTNPDKTCPYHYPKLKLLMIADMALVSGIVAELCLWAP